MKKNNYDKNINIIDEVFTNAIKNGIFHLSTEDDSLDGRTITVYGHKVINFGSCSYLGLELDKSVIESSISATRKYGTQFSSSRAYLSLGLYGQLEEMFRNIFKTPVVIAPTTTLAHSSAIPVVVGDGDAVILDFHVHASVQDAVSKLYKRGIPVELIRHSQLNELEDRIKKLGAKYHKIWYMTDGVNSMYGDLVPIHELVKLVNKYNQLHLYIDDAHGMSWTGLNGCGYIYSQIAPHPKIIVTTSLAKGFGIAGGGVISSPDVEIIRKIRTCGTSLIFSGPMGPYALGAAIGSAQIHLSDKMKVLQANLNDSINYTNALIREYKLPNVIEAVSPIFFVGISSLKAGYNMDKRLLQEGFYANIGLFPGVPMRRTGIRFTNTLHHSKKDIKAFIEAMAYHFPKVLEEEGLTEQQIYKAFEISGYKESEINERHSAKSKNFTIQHERTINAFEKKDWDAIPFNSPFDREGLAQIEKSFSGNILPEENWEFHYYMVKDTNNKPIIATYLTVALTKDDMFDDENISIQIDEKRESEKYFLTSKSFILGNLMSLGNHLFIDRENPQWKDALEELLYEILEEKQRQQVSAVYLRDFDPTDGELREFFMDRDFIQAELPDNHIIDHFDWNSPEEYLMTLKSDDRTKIRKNVLKNTDHFEVEYVRNPSADRVKHYYKLYTNIRNKNKEINIFGFPEKLFHVISSHDGWDIIELNIKPEHSINNTKTTVAIGFCYRAKYYYTCILGMDYTYMDHEIYRQMLYQVVTRTKQLGLGKAVLGMTASIEKQRFGAKPQPTVAYVLLDDTYNRKVIDVMSNRKK